MHQLYHQYREVLQRDNCSKSNELFYLMCFLFTVSIHSLRCTFLCTPREVKIKPHSVLKRWLFSFVFQLIK